VDAIVDYAIWLWSWAAVALVVPVVLLPFLRLAIRLLRVVPALRDRLAGTAKRLKAWTSRSHAFFGWLLGAAVLWPVLIVVLPVVGVTWTLFRWLIPDRAPRESSHPGHERPPAMGWPLRLVTATAIAQLLATALLLWLVKVPTTPVAIGTLDGSVIHVDRLIVWTVSAFLPIGFGLLLSGAWVHTLSRVIVLAMVALASRPDRWDGAAAQIWFGLLAGAAVAAIAPWLMSRRPSARGPMTFVARASGLALVMGAFEAATAWALTAAGQSYPVYLDRLVSELAFLVTPVLFLAGTDFADAGAAFARLGMRWGWRPDQPGATVAAAVAAAVISSAFALGIGDIDATGIWVLLLLGAAVAAHSALMTVSVNALAWSRGGGFWIGVAMVAATFGLLVLVVATEWRLLAAGMAAVAVGATLPLIRPGKPGTWSGTAVPIAAVVVLAVVLAGSREVAVMVRAAYEVPPGARATTFATQHVATPATPISVAAPVQWTAVPRRGALYLGVGDDPYDSGALLVAILTAEQAGGFGLGDIERWVAGLLPEYEGIDLEFDSDVGTAAGDWRVSNSTMSRGGRRYRVDVYDQRRVDGGWLLIFVRGERYQRYFAPTFARVLGSWRFDASATVPDPVPAPDLRRRVASLGGFGFVPVLFAPVGYLLLFYRRAEPPTGTLRDHAALMAIAVAATAIFFLPDTTFVEFWRGSEAPGNPLATLQLALAAATVAIAVVAMIVRQAPLWAVFLSELARLNLAVLVLAAVYAVYGAAIPLGNHHVEFEVALFLLALLWDLSTSGREITRGDGPIFARPARVLAYMGYLVVVATLVLFISTQTVADTGQPVPKLVESEDVVRQGLVWLGAPLLLLRAVLRWVAAVRTGQLDP
jgi:hypothetical protein